MNTFMQQKNSSLSNFHQYAVTDIGSSFLEGLKIVNNGGLTTGPVLEINICCNGYKSCARPAPPNVLENLVDPVA